MNEQTQDKFGARQKRIRKGTIEIRKEECPTCGHNKMFGYPSPMSNIKKKCTRCEYIEMK